MKNSSIPSVALISALFCVLPQAQAQQDSNQITLSGRVGFNISARFKSIAAPAPSPNVRTAPDGLLYNYEDGYVHTDISENFGGQTWNWGYDNSSRQVVGNTIEMSRAAAPGTIPS